MEVLKGIIRDIKINREIARERKEARKKQEALRNFFNSPAGERHLACILSEWKVDSVRKREVKAIDNEFKQFRLAVEVDEETFRNIILERKPEVIKYRITHFDDQMDAGDALIEVDEKVAILASGMLFSQARGVEVGILEDLPIPYTKQIKDYPGFRPWKELTLKNPEGY